MRRAEPLRPARLNGHLYYFRLTSPYGPFYKLGFTTAASVQERFRFGENADAASIERVLCFVYLDNAANAEQKLHAYFADQRAFNRFSAISSMPLFRNGQSELYYEDILGLDTDYCKAKAAFTREQVAKAMGSHPRAVIMMLQRWMSSSEGLVTMGRYAGIQATWVERLVGKSVVELVRSFGTAAPNTGVRPSREEEWLYHIEPLIAKLRTVSPPR